MKLTYTNAAIRTLAKCPKALRDRIVMKIQTYAANPAAFAKVKRLQGRDDLRMRIGDWRVVFTVDGETMTVRDVGHRSEIYE